MLTTSGSKMTEKPAMKGLAHLWPNHVALRLLGAEVDAGLPALVDVRDAEHSAAARRLGASGLQHARSQKKRHKTTYGARGFSRSTQTGV